MMHLVFAAYLCLTTIIMLNMLIAMMNSTYSLVSSTRAATWRIESLRTALWFERRMPLIKRSLFLRFKTYRRVVDDRPRWYIAYNPEQVSSFVDVLACLLYSFTRMYTAALCQLCNKDVR